MSEENTKICPRCKIACDVGDAFCGKCGSPFATHEANMPTKHSKLPQSRQPITTPANTFSSSFVYTQSPPALDPTLPATPPFHAPPSRHPKKYLMFLGVLIVLIIGALIIGVEQFNRGTCQATNNSNSTGIQEHSTAVPRPITGTVLYQENGLDNWKGWSGSSDWKVLNGILLNDGTYDMSTEPPTITSPYQVEGTSDYAVEAKIRVQRQNTTNRSIAPSFGISMRGASAGCIWQGYWALFAASNATDPQPTAYILNNGQDFSASILGKASFDPVTNWHTYRVEVKSNDIKLLVDGALKVEVQDNLFLTGGQIGLISYESELSIASFKIVAL